MSLEVVLERGGVMESRHRVHAAVVAPDGGLRGWSGDPDLVTFMRSAAKPFQALPLVADGVVKGLGLTSAELAVCCGSHGGEESHLSRVRSLLRRAGCREEDLECGPVPPLYGEAAELLRERGEPPRPIHNNCSGKHAGMLALARWSGWETRGYRVAGHPVQGRILDEMARWTGMSRVRTSVGVDGCGVVCFALPIRAMAVGFARLARASREGEDGPRTVLDAMAAHPFQVAGTGRLCTELIEATEGRIIAKVGAEGIYCAVHRATGIGMALKVEDGARRGVEPALVSVLAELELVDDEELGRLDHWSTPVVANTRAEPAARLVCRGGLEGGGS